MPNQHVTRCPHCNHALNVPDEFLGRVVTCLECKAPFQAPVLQDGTLTAPTPLPKPSRIPARLFVPTFGLMLLGFAGLFVNGYLAWWFQVQPQAAARFAEANMLFMMETDPPAPPAKDGKKLSEDEEKQRREEHAERQQQLAKEAAGGVSVEKMKLTRVAFAAVSAGVLAGGLCFVLRRGYYFCYVACLLAAVNSPDIGCCFVGVVIGAWGFMALISDDGQRYFRRTPANGAT